MTRARRTAILALVGHANDGTWPLNADRALSTELDEAWADAEDAEDTDLTAVVEQAFNVLTGR